MTSRCCCCHKPLTLAPWRAPDVRLAGPEERTLSHERTQRDTVGHAGQDTSWRGIFNAAKDPKAWLFVSMQHCHLGAKGFTNCFLTAVRALGFKQTSALVLTCLRCMTVLADRSHCRDITIAKGVVIFGVILGGATLNMGADTVSKKIRASENDARLLYAY